MHTSHVPSKDQLISTLKRSVSEFNEYRAVNPTKTIDLAGADLAGANLKRANLQNVSLEKANLTDADLTDADLSEASLRAAILVNTIFTRTNLYRVDFSYSRGLKRKYFEHAVKQTASSIDFAD